MARTSKQIEGDILHLLEKSELADNITGKCYRERNRPRNSEKEDAIVIFTTGTAEQIEKGVVTINLYVPDIDPWGDGVLTEDGERVEELQDLMQEWVDRMSNEVSFYQLDQRGTIHTNYDPDVRQTFIVAQLDYRYIGEGKAKMEI